jgi:hypothetical protein
MSNVAVDLFAAFATDDVAEEQGVYTKVPGAGDTDFLVARSNNKSYNRIMAREVKKFKSLLDSKGEAADAKAEEIFIYVLARTVLLGWNGTILYKGEQMPYSRENAEKLLSHKDFRVALITVSDNLETFKKVKDAEDEGN